MYAVVNLSPSTGKYMSGGLVKCCLCPCLDVNQGGTNHNRCTHTHLQSKLILHARAYYNEP